MPAAPRIALIHATRVAMAPIEAALAELWPEARALTLLDESLTVDAEAGGDRAALDARINALCRHAEGMAVAGILYTCSAFGPAIEQAAARAAVPVLKPNEAMFEAAISAGEDIVLLYTFAPALEGMAREFAEAAARRGSPARLRPVLAAGAMEALRAGDRAGHDVRVAEAAAAAMPADAVMLAHFSTAPAAAQVAAALAPRGGAPVFTSPASAVTKLRALVTGGSPC